MNCNRKDLLLYGITDRKCLNGRDILVEVERALRGGVTFLQLREKNISRETYLREAIAVREICRRYHVPLIINDDVEIAKMSDADGVHLGLKDMSVEQARRILGPDKIIGASARTVERALEARRDGADYLGCGAVFATDTKKDAQAIKKETLWAITRTVDIPVVAIGGINKNNIMELRESGISGAAVVSGIFGQPDVEKAARELRKIIGTLVL